MANVMKLELARAHTHTHRPLTGGDNNGNDTTNWLRQKQQFETRVSIVSSAWLAQTDCSSHCIVLLFTHSLVRLLLFSSRIFRALIMTHTRADQQKETSFHTSLPFMHNFVHPQGVAGSDGICARCLTHSFNRIAPAI